MEVEITIVINVDSENFDKQELRSDILNGFSERTGYDIQHLDIKTEG